MKKIQTTIYYANSLLKTAKTSKRMGKYQKTFKIPIPHTIYILFSRLNLPKSQIWPTLSIYFT